MFANSFYSNNPRLSLQNISGERLLQQSSVLSRSPSPSRRYVDSEEHKFQDGTRGGPQVSAFLSSVQKPQLTQINSAVNQPPQSFDRNFDSGHINANQINQQSTILSEFCKEAVEFNQKEKARACKETLQRLIISGKHNKNKKALQKQHRRDLLTLTKSKSVTEEEIRVADSSASETNSKDLSIHHTGRSIKSKGIQKSINLACPQKIQMPHNQVSSKTTASTPSAQSGVLITIRVNRQSTGNPTVSSFGAQHATGEITQQLRPENQLNYVQSKVQVNGMQMIPQQIQQTASVQSLPVIHQSPPNQESLPLSNSSAASQIIQLNGQQRDMRSLSQEELQMFQKQQTMLRNNQFRQFMQAITDALPPTIRGVVQPTNRYLDVFGDYLNLILRVFQDQAALRQHLESLQIQVTEDGIKSIEAAMNFYKLKNFGVFLFLALNESHQGLQEVIQRRQVPGPLTVSLKDIDHAEGVRLLIQCADKYYYTQKLQYSQGMYTEMNRAQELDTRVGKLPQKFVLQNAEFDPLFDDI